MIIGLSKTLPRSFLLLFVLVSLPNFSQAQTKSPAPELVSQTGHTFKINRVIYSPDGAWLASGGADNLVKIWDTATGRELRTLDAHLGWIKSLAVSADGKLLASGSNDKTVKVWRVATGENQFTLQGFTKPVEAVAFGAGHKFIAAGGADGNLKIFDAANGAEIKSLTGANAIGVTALAFNPSGEILAAGYADGSLKLFETASGKETRALKPHAAKINALAVSADGKFLATASADKTARVWDAASGKEKFVLSGHAASVIAVAFGADNVLRTGGADVSVRFWNAANGKEAQAARSAVAEVQAETVAFSPDGKSFAVNMGTRTIELYNFNQPAAAQQLKSGASVLFAVAVSPDNKWLASGTNERTVRLWDLEAGREIPKLTGLTGYVTCVAFSPDSKFLAAGSVSGVAKVWNLAEGREVFTLTGHGDGINAVAFSPDGKTIATASLDRTVKLWDAATGKDLRTFTEHQAEVTAVAFQPSSGALLSADAGGALVWREANTFAAKTLNSDLSAGRIYAITFSADGGRFAVGAEKAAQLWDAGNANAPRLSLQPNGATFAVAFAPDGKTLTTAGANRALKRWNTAHGSAQDSLGGHTATVNSLTYARGGKFLLSGGEDGKLIVRDAGTGAPLVLLASGFESDEWLVATPQGLFDGSPAAWNSILWRFGGDTFNVAPVEIYFNEYYSPGVLSEIFAGRAPKPAIEIQNKDRRQPRVTITQNANVSGSGGSSAHFNAANQTAPRTVKIKLDVAEAAQGSGARDVRLFRNGLLVKVWRGDVLQGANARALEAEIPLVAGENQFTAYAYNRDNIKSADAALSIAGATTARPATAHVLVVGINKYANERFNLRYAVADAEGFAAAVVKSQTGLNQFAKVEVAALLDADATKANILRALQILSGANKEPLPPDAPAALKTLTPAQPEDAVVIYYAGHGTAQNARFYMLPHDLGYMGARTKPTPEGLKTILAHGISDEELGAAIEGLDASQLLLVLDACNSGQAIEAADKRRGPMNTRGLAQLAYEKGMYILTAAESYQAAVEATRLGHGYLTYTLIDEGLTGMADIAPRDGRIMAREWINFAARRVPELQTVKPQPTNAPPPDPALQQTRELVQDEDPADTGDKKNRNVQRPRIFYRRELDRRQITITRVSN